MPSRSAAHTALVADIMLAFGARSDLRLWQQNTGAAITQKGALVRFGVKGQADISGLRRPTGQRIEIEVKTGSATTSAAQRKYRAMIEAMGGLYVVARSVDDVARALNS